MVVKSYYGNENLGQALRPHWNALDRSATHYFSDLDIWYEVSSYRSKSADQVSLETHLPDLKWSDTKYTEMTDHEKVDCGCVVICYFPTRFCVCCAKLLIQSLKWLFHNFSETHHFTDHLKDNWKNAFCNMRTLCKQNIGSNSE